MSEPSVPAPAEDRGRRLPELVRLFLKLGTIAFGGPAAHIAMLEDEVVARRKWMDRQHFLDLVGATNLIPGPNSTEMTMHVGYERAGWRGLMTAGASFILPAVLVTGFLAWLYVGYGTLPSVEPYLYGIKPAVLAVILGAVWRLGKPAVKDWRFAVLGAGVVALLLRGVGEVPALLLGGVTGMLWFRAVRGGGTRGSEGRAAVLLAPAAQAVGSNAVVPGAAQAAGAPGATVGATAGAALAAASGSVAGASIGAIFLFFLKIGAVLYGSGYVLVAFLEGGLVADRGWLTQAQLLDAIAIGQLTPGPVLSTATFIGYVLAGVPGAGVATVGIFLPSFLFVAALNPLIPRLRASAWMSAFLDAVNVSAIALMAAVSVALGQTVLVSWPAWVIAVGAAVLVLRYRTNAVWLVLGGAVVGRLLWGGAL
jgi:chromate transporter